MTPEEYEAKRSLRNAQSVEQAEPPEETPQDTSTTPDVNPIEQLASDIETETSVMQTMSENSWDFATQTNKTIFNTLGSAVDLSSWATRKIITSLGISEETAERFAPTNSFGGSASLKKAGRALGVQSAEGEPDSFGGYLGMTFGEFLSVMVPMLSVTKKVQGTKTVTQRIAKSINDEAVNTPIKFLGAEAGATVAIAGTRMAADDADLNPTAKLFAEFAAGVVGALSGYSAVKLGDDLITKLKGLTPEDAFKAAIDGDITPNEVKQILGRDDVPEFKDMDFEFLSKPKERDVINEDGSFNIDESQSPKDAEPQPEINVTETTQGETQPLEVTVGGEKIPSDVPVTPKDTPEAVATPEATPAPKTPEVAPEAPTRYETVDKLRERLDNTDFDAHPEQFGDALKQGNDLAEASQNTQSQLHREIAAHADATDGQLNVEATEKLLDEVQFTRHLNQTINDPLKTNGGRILLASRGDRDKFNFQGTYSLRALRSDEALAKLEDTLNSMLSIGKYDADIKPLFDDFLEIKPRMKEESAVIRAKEKEVKPVVDGEETPTPKPKKELTPEETTAKVQEELLKRKKKLQEELDAKQKEFTGQKDLEEPKGKQKEQDPEVKDLQQRIKWYNDVEGEIATVAELEARLAKLAGIEGAGDISTLRKTTKDNLTPPSNNSPQVAELNKKIAQSKARMKQKLKEIDAAQEEIQNPKVKKTQEQLDAEAETRSIESLEKQLEDLRAIRSGNLDKPDAKPTREKSAQERDLEERIKFYRDEEKQIIQLEKAKEELARLASVEGEGNITKLRTETKDKPEFPTKPDQVADIKKKIAQSKTRMRQKLRDIDNAQKKMDQEALNVQMFKEIEEAIYKEIEQDTVGWFTKAGRTIRQARQLSLIWQLPSVLAGAATNIVAFARTAIQPTSTYLFSRAQGKGHSMATRLAEAEKAGRFITFRDWVDTGRAAARTFKEGQSVTTGGRGRYDEGMVANRSIGTAQVVSKARASAQQRLDAANNVQKKFLDLGIGGKFLEMLSISYRAANVIDEIPKRQLIKGRQHAKYLKEGIEKFPDDPKAAAEHTAAQIAKKWEDQDGIKILTEQARFDDEVRQVQEELGLALGRIEDPDVYTPAFEAKVIKSLSDMANGDDILAYGANAMFPFIRIAMRLFYRSAKTATFVGSGVKAKFANPYDKKIKGVQKQLDDIETALNAKTVKDNPERVKAFEDTRPELYKRLEVLQQRKTNYNAEAFTETLIGGGLLAFGGAAGWNGYGTGSMQFMTDKQREVAEKNGIKPYTMLGVSYKDFYPLSLGLAVATEIGGWTKAKANDELTKDQDFWNVSLRVFTDLVTELNLTQGVTTTQKMFSEVESMRNQAATRLLASYVPIPAVARKIVSKLTSGGKVSDLKGGDFYERMAYYAFGIGATNKKTDRFGYELKDETGLMQTFVARQFPEFGKKKIDKFGRIMRTDREELIQDKPDMLTARINMYDWRDEEGVSLKSHYDKHLRKLRIGGQTMKQAVRAKLQDPTWNKIFNMEYFEDESGRLVNEGLLELNSVLSKYYVKARKDLAADTRLTKRFLNEDNVTLSSELVKRKTKTTSRPQKQRSVASQYD
jgi:hypothetical protein